MSDTTPHDEPDEVEALTGRAEPDASAGPGDQGDASAPDESEAAPGADGTDATGQDVDDAGTGTGDTSDDPDLDPPD